MSAISIYINHWLVSENQIMRNNFRKKLELIYKQKNNVYILGKYREQPKENIISICCDIMTHIIGHCPLCKEHVIRATSYDNSERNIWVHYGYIPFDYLNAYCSKCKNHVSLCIG